MISPTRLCIATSCCGARNSCQYIHAQAEQITAINADTMEIYTELVPFDPALAQRMSDRAVKVITATQAGELLSRSFNDPTHFECRMCAYANRCWSVEQ